MKILFIAFALLSKELFANGGTGGFDIMQFLPFIAVLIIFYFLVMRPQQKKAQTHQAMLKELRKGDRVITAGGILGTIDKVVNDNEISVEIAEGVKIKVIKSTINNVLDKTNPVSDSSKSQKTEEDAPKSLLENNTKKPSKNNPPKSAAKKAPVKPKSK